MFRKLNRVKQELENSECKNILKEELRGVLSLNGDDGYPYGMPMNHFYVEEENRLYFHGGMIGYKMDCIKKDNKCSYCVINKGEKRLDHWSLIFKSVIVFGKIHLVEDINEIKRISKLLSYKFTKDENEIDNEIKLSLNHTAMFYIDIEYMTGKKVNER